MANMGFFSTPTAPQSGVPYASISHTTVNDNPFTPTYSRYSYPLDASGRPIMPEFQTIADPSTGLLKSQYQLQNNLNTDALNQLQSEAMRPAGQMSKWGQMALAQAQDQNAAQAAGQTAQARNNLAMSGGLRTGARERLAGMGANSQLMGNQAALRNVQTQDEQNRMNLLQQMPAMQQQAAQYGSDIQNKNIGNTLNELLQSRLATQNQYNEAMKGWAAINTAAATPSSSKK